MQAIAAWLVARRMHAVLALALTFMLPFAPLFSGAVMVMLVLFGGARIAALQGLAAMAALAFFTVLSGNAVADMLLAGIAIWLPVFLLACLLRWSRSLILTMQVSVIVALLVTLGFYAVVADPILYWTEVLTYFAAILAQAGLSEQAALIVAQQDLIAPQMTMLMVLTTWSMTALVVIFGYAIYQALPNRKGEFGHFRDLNFGHVLALVMAVTSVLALLSGAEWIRNFAFVGFVIFWIQGLAVLHWLQAYVPLPFIVLVMIYALLPFLSALLVLALAVLGYTDAWFNYRARIAGKKAQ